MFLEEFLVKSGHRFKYSNFTPFAGTTNNGNILRWNSAHFEFTPTLAGWYVFSTCPNSGPDMEFTTAYEAADQLGYTDVEAYIDVEANNTVRCGNGGNGIIWR